MKKVIAILFVIFTVSTHALFAQNPIPSWNVPVYHRANFQELSKTPRMEKQISRGKRVLHVHASRGSSAPVTCGTVWVYSLDSLNIIGPLQLCEGETLEVEIDENAWGVLVESEAHLEVDVWIEESKSALRPENHFIN